MILYKSTVGDAPPDRFNEAILNGFAPDGGLYVPDSLPHYRSEVLEEMATLSYVDLAQRIISDFIDPSVIPGNDLRLLLANSFNNFESVETAPVNHLRHSGVYIQELFHGPTLSFKDMAMGVLINCMDYFLTQKKEKCSLVLATTGDTGPAAAYAAAGKKTLECWPLYPRGMISDEQERQMTTLDAVNVHPVGVEGCTNGGDDLDIVVARLFDDETRKMELKLSSVNSINWCRVLVQTVHYFFAYFKTAESIGEEIAFSVPTGAFGNLCAGYIARSMGLPVSQFICATNENATLHRLFSDGTLSKKALKQTVSSAIDIILPYNFWRFLYFNCDCDPAEVRRYMSEFEQRGTITFPTDLYERMQHGFISYSISDHQTLSTINHVYTGPDGYLLDPHGAVAVAAALNYQKKTTKSEKVVCLATAHPAKFPDVIAQALGSIDTARHPALEAAKKEFHHLRTCDLPNLETALTTGMARQLQRN